MDNKLTMTVAEMAAHLNLSKPTAYSLVKQEGFPALNIGKRVIIPVTEFKMWLSEQARR
jgi:excisionase family DNA binding protein